MAYDDDEKQFDEDKGIPDDVLGELNDEDEEDEADESEEGDEKPWE